MLAGTSAEVSAGPLRRRKNTLITSSTSSKAKAQAMQSIHCSPLSEVVPSRFCKKSMSVGRNTKSKAKP